MYPPSLVGWWSIVKTWISSIRKNKAKATDGKSIQAMVLKSYKMWETFSFKNEWKRRFCDLSQNDGFNDRSYMLHVTVWMFLVTELAQ